MDGTGVPMRKAEVAGRLGKQADGLSKTREVKLCTVWSRRGGTPTAYPCGMKGVGVLAAIETPPSATRTRPGRPTPSAWNARLAGEASIERAGTPSRTMGPHGSEY